MKQYLILVGVLAVLLSVFYFNNDMLASVYPDTMNYKISQYVAYEVINQEDSYPDYAKVEEAKTRLESQGYQEIEINQYFYQGRLIPLECLENSCNAPEISKDSNNCPLYSDYKSWVDSYPADKCGTAYYYQWCCKRAGYRLYKSTCSRTFSSGSSCGGTKPNTNVYKTNYAYLVGSRYCPKGLVKYGNECKTPQLSNITSKPNEIIYEFTNSLSSTFKKLLDLFLGWFR